VTRHTDAARTVHPSARRHASRRRRARRANALNSNRSCFVELNTDGFVVRASTELSPNGLLAVPARRAQREGLGVHVSTRTGWSFALRLSSARTGCWCSRFNELNADGLGVHVSSSSTRTGSSFALRLSSARTGCWLFPLDVLNVKGWVFMFPPAHLRRRRFSRAGFSPHGRKGYHRRRRPARAEGDSG
jgi:hypothetical protein